MSDSMTLKHGVAVVDTHIHQELCRIPSWRNGRGSGSSHWSKTLTEKVKQCGKKNVSEVASHHISLICRNTYLLTNFFV